VNLSYQALLTRSYVYISAVFFTWFLIEWIYEGSVDFGMLVVIIPPLIFAGISRLWGGRLTILSVLFFVLCMLMVSGMPNFLERVKGLFNPVEVGEFLISSLMIWGSLIVLFTGIQAFRYRKAETPVIAPRAYTTTVAAFQFIPLIILSLTHVVLFFF
tara:strand:- start:9920 stop:10393 length:474 start_codon:yes stop_codon:yes gene_type:complete